MRKVTFGGLEAEPPSFNAVVSTRSGFKETAFSDSSSKSRCLCSLTLLESTAFFSVSFSMENP